MTGGAGSGKTRFASLLAASRGVTHYDLDGLALSKLPLGTDPSDALPLVATLSREVEAISAGDAWISDGSYVTWVRPLFDRADLIVYLDIPWRVTAYRIVARHVKAELARNNRFPGWRRLLRFWLYCRRFYNDANGEGVNEFGNPRTRRYLAEQLQGYAAKLVVCRTSSEAESLLRRLL